MINTPLNDESIKSEKHTSCVHLCMLYGLLLKVYKAFSTCEMPYALRIMTSKWAKISIFGSFSSFACSAGLERSCSVSGARMFTDTFSRSAGRKLRSVGRTLLVVLEEVKLRQGGEVVGTGET